MLYFVVFLTFLISANSKEQTRKRPYSTYDDLADLCEHIQRRHRHDYTEIPTTNTPTFIDYEFNDEELRELLRSPVKSKTERTSSRYDSGTTRPWRIVGTDSNAKGNAFDNEKLRRIVKTFLSTEDDGDIDIDDSLNESRIDYGDNINLDNVKNRNDNRNRNANKFGVIKEQPRVKVSSKLIPSLKSKKDSPIFIESKVGDSRDGDPFVVVEYLETRENHRRGLKKDEAIDTDLKNFSDPKKTSSMEGDSDLSQAEDVKKARTVTTREPIEIVTPITPKINVTESLSSDIDTNKKTPKNAPKLKNRERLRRRKDKRKPALKKNELKPMDDLPSLNKTSEITSKYQLKSENKMKGGDSKGEELIISGDKNKTPDNDTNRNATNALESPEEIKSVGKKNDKLKVEVPGEIFEEGLLEERNGSMVVPNPTLKSIGSLESKINKNTRVKEELTLARGREDLGKNYRAREIETNDQEENLELKKISKGSRALGIPTNSNRIVNQNRPSTPNLNRLKADKNLIYPQEEAELARTLPLDDYEESKFKKSPYGRNSDVDETNWESEPAPLIIKSDRIARNRNNNVNKNTNVNSIGDPARRSNQNKNVNRNVNQNVYTDVNRHKNRVSGLAKIVRRDDLDDDDDDDDEGTIKMLTSRRNINRNTNVNKNNLEISGEKSNDRVYKTISNRRTLERFNPDDFESNGDRLNNRNVNRNININRNVNSLPPIRRRTQSEEDIKLSQKAVESIMQEVIQLRKQLAEKEAKSTSSPK